MITGQPTALHRHLHAKARALAVILTGEFGVPFTFFDAASGQEVFAADGEEWAPRPDYDPGLVRQIAQEGQCRVQRLDDVYNLLTLVIFDANRPALVAAGVLRSLVGNRSERPRELDQTRRWLAALSDRLRLTELHAVARRAADDQAAQVKRAWEVILGLDAAIRHVRLARDPGKNGHLILQGARNLLGVQCLAWVSSRPGALPVAEGELCMALTDCRHLGELLQRLGGDDPRKPVIWNADAADLWGQRFPQLRNLMAFAVADPEGGWLIAMNKQTADDAAGRPADDAARSFRRADAALFAPFAALFGFQLRGSRRYQELKGLLVGLTRSLTSALDAKDTFTFGHSERVARIALEVGQELGLRDDELSDIYLAGLLHDIGKIGIPDALLAKPGALEPAEMERVKQHVTIGYQMLADLQPLRNLLPGVLHHHERFDGKGYPDGLAGEQIPMIARILAVADAFDAMSTRRPYRDALDISKAEDLLRKGAGIQWDARVVEAFFRCRDRVHLIRQRGVGQSLNAALDTALRCGDGSSCTSLILPPPA